LANLLTERINAFKPPTNLEDINNYENKQLFSSTKIPNYDIQYDKLFKLVKTKEQKIALLNLLFDLKIPNKDNIEQY